MSQVIVNFTPTGMIPTRQMSAHVPLSVSEIVEDVLRAKELGVTTVHLHARDEATGEPTYQAEVYARLIEGIRAYAKDLVLGVSTSGRRFVRFSQRAACLQLDGQLKPDMGSLTLSSVNFNKQASVNSPEMIQRLAEEMAKQGILPELEAFDAGMINYAKYLAARGMLRAPYYFNLILGNVACAQADLLHVGIMVRDLPPESYWSLAGVGDTQLTMNSLAIAMGAGVRVGLEDNLWFDSKRTRLATNADLLGRVHTLIDANGHEVMPPATFRKLLGMEPGNGRYGLRAQG
jgi:3-keto-5-aminohexanoate cleavage enzyme